LIEALLFIYEWKVRISMYKVLGKKSGKSGKSYDSLQDPHDFIHDFDSSKICSAYGSGESVDWETLKSVIGDPEYVCSGCGRSASDASSLCSPEFL